MQNAKEQKKEYQKPEMKESLLKTEGSLLQSSDPFGSDPSGWNGPGA